MTASPALSFATLRRALLVLLMLCCAAPLLAQQSLPAAPYANRQLEDPVQEAVALELMATLRCLECQSQSIHDSDSPMAGDMRHQVRIRIAAGEPPDAIRTWLMDRYGDYVSYTPQVSATTWPLFVVPLLILLAAAAIFWRRFGRRA